MAGQTDRAISSLTKKTFLTLSLVASLFVLLSKEQEFCGTETSDKAVSIGDTLVLECDCQTSAAGDNDFRVKWEKLKVESQPQVVSASMSGERTLSLNVNSTSGGVYRCACEPCEDRCARCFRVNVRPFILDFTIEPSVIRVGETFTVTCRAVGDTPLQFKVFHAGSDGRDLTDDLESVENGRTVSVNATLKDDGEYRCIVSNDVGTYSETDTVTVYDPPQIIRSENSSVDLESDHTALLTCVVKLGSSRSANVSWFSLDGGLKTDIHHSDKHTFISTTPPTSDTMKFILLVHHLAKDDLGRYLCQLESKYNALEDEQVLSITTKECPNKPSEDGDSGLCHGWTIGTILLAVFFFLLVAVVLILAYLVWHYKTEATKSLQRIYISPSVSSVCSSPNDGARMELPSYPSSSRSSINGDLVSVHIDPARKGSSFDMRKRLTSDHENNATVRESTTPTTLH